MAEAKISAELDRRLARLGPGSKVQAIVLLDIGSLRGSQGKTRSAASRAAALRRARETAEGIVPEIDQILQRFGGKRLAEHANALGGLPIETTPAGVWALAASSRVKAILEDQPISLVN